MTAALLAAESERHLVASYSTPLIGVNSKNPAPCVLACLPAWARAGLMGDSRSGPRDCSKAPRKLKLELVESEDRELNWSRMAHQQ